MNPVFILKTSEIIAPELIFDRHFDISGFREAFEKPVRLFPGFGKDRYVIVISYYERLAEARDNIRRHQQVVSYWKRNMHYSVFFFFGQVFRAGSISHSVNFAQEFPAENGFVKVESFFRLSVKI